jgi:hypothetical protein
MKPALRHLRPLAELRRALLWTCGAGYLLGHVPIALSQDSAKKVAASPASQDTSKKATAKAADSAQTRPPEQLDALVAPIALYSDDLLAQTLVASTYPLEIVQLQQWLAKNPGLKDKALADSVAKQPWDPSIQSMAAIPEVVKRLADDIQWTTDLGNAFLAQQADVMSAVQRMRKKAKDKGALETTEQQKVETKVVEKKEVIVVESQNPEVIYVPSYSPTVVYGPAYYPYPPIYYPPYTPGMAFVSFGVGMMWGAAMWGGACCHAGWGGNNIYINNNNNFNRNTNINRNTNVNRGQGGNWQHNPQHRGGAPYADQRTANRYGGSTRGQSGAGASNRASSAGQGQRGAGVSDRSAAGGQRATGTGDRSAASGAGNRGGGRDRSMGAGGGGVGGDPIGNRSIPKDTGRSSGGGGWGGGSGGYDGASARASSSRGASSMGRSGGGSRGGGGGRRR